MGTSLSGLTPATTFDGLLKVGDNDPLTADLKAISTGDGTDTILQLSNSALKISGTGNTANDIPFSIVNSDGTELLRIQSASSSNTLTVPSARISNVNFVSGNVIAGNNTNLRLVPQQGGVSINKDYSNADASTMLHIKGSGATSATTSLLVQDSAGGDMLKVTDDGIVALGNSNVIVDGASIKRGSTDFNLGTITSLTSYSGHVFKAFDGAAYSEVMRVQGGDQFVGIGETTPTAKLHIKGDGSSAATTSLLVQNNSGNNLINARDDGEVTIGSTMQIKGTEISAYHSLGLKTYTDAGWTANLVVTGNGAPSKVGIGETTPTARLHVKGSGNDNTTTSLLVQNSDGHNALKVSDDGRVRIENNHTTNKFIIGWPDGSESLIFDYTSIRTGGGNPLFVNGITTHIGSAGGTRISAATTGTTIFGSGATSATTALLVQNSAGTDLLKVLDDGSVFSNGGGAKLASNTGFGEGVLGSITTGTNHTAFGLGALKDVTTGVSNTAMGWWSGYNTTLGSNNAFFGTMSAYTNTSGANNTGIGTRVLYNNGTANDNTAVGYLADSAGFSGNVILGRGATATADNQFVVGSSTINAGAVDVVGDPTPTHTWEVVINGVKYRILLQEVV